MIRQLPVLLLLVAGAFACGGGGSGNDGGNGGTSEPPRDVHQLLECDFEDDDLCEFESEGPPGLPKADRDDFRQRRKRQSADQVSWTTAETLMGNPITGIPEPANGQYSGAVYLLQGEYATMESEVNYEQPFTLTFNYFEATEGVQLRVCCDSMNDCSFETDVGVADDERQWYDGSATCDQGASTVVIVCDNTGTNQGACAIDDILMETTQSDVANDYDDGGKKGKKNKGSLKKLSKTKDLLKVKGSPARIADFADVPAGR